MKRADARPLLERELDRRLADVARRLDGTVSKSSIVIATALVLAAIPAEPTPGRWLPLGFAVSAVLLATPTMFYRDGDEIPIRGLLTRVREHTKDTLANEVFDKKLAMLNAEEAAMDRRARQLTLSYLALATSSASIVLTHSIGF